jgi:hypothetical protein
MSERATRKGKRQAAPPRHASGRAGAAESKRSAGSRLEAIERERDQLKAQLADAQALIAKLQQARDEAVNRIDWAIDSLHNVLESDA